MVYVLIHEIFHIIAISPVLYPLFDVQMNLIRNIIITSSSGTTESSFVSTPKVVQEARKHFDCDTLEGIYLENEGTESSRGAHFEKLHFGNELMTS